MRELVFMKCGCTANARREPGGEPSCAVHGTMEQAPVPNLSGRVARCSYGAHRDVPSELGLPFFSHHPDQTHDRYYCGCFGWD